MFVYNDLGPVQVFLQIRQTVVCEASSPLLEMMRGAETA